ncbi:hypothetical protein [Pseudomonas sp. GV047]|uniref:hypothetical protein n=1 Tax=Pseudomonas sp. GV047 TaxID=2135751 RepID=UPI000D3A1E90|nr:hypothetical protein [Pseudomonas sp. GV047]
MTITTTVSTKLDMKGLTNLARRMATLAKLQPKVGFFEDKYDDGMPVAQVAAWNEHGSRFHPERPFMKETVNSAQTRQAMVRLLVKAAQASISGKGNARSIMAMVGKLLVGEIKATISNYPGHNSLSTIEAKGFDRPLYDTGKMLESVKFMFAGDKA